MKILTKKHVKTVLEYHLTADDGKLYVLRETIRSNSEVPTYKVTQAGKAVHSDVFFKVVDYYLGRP